MPKTSISSTLNLWTGGLKKVPSYFLREDESHRTTLFFGDNLKHKNIRMIEEIRKILKGRYLNTMQIQDHLKTKYRNGLSMNRLVNILGKLPEFHATGRVKIPRGTTIPYKMQTWTYRPER